MQSSWSRNLYSSILTERIGEASSERLKLLWQAMQDGQLSKNELVALGITLGASTALLAGMISDDDAPLRDMTEQELLSPDAPAAAWNELLLLMLHALRQAMRKPELAEAIGSDFVALLSKLDQTTGLRLTERMPALEALQLDAANSSQQPYDVYMRALNEFHRALLGKDINDRSPATTLVPTESDVRSQFPLALYFVHIYLNIWTEFYQELENRLERAPEAR